MPWSYKDGALSFKDLGGGKTQVQVSYEIHWSLTERWLQQNASLKFKEGIVLHANDQFTQSNKPWFPAPPMEWGEMLGPAHIEDIGVASGPDTNGFITEQHVTKYEVSRVSLDEDLGEVVQLGSGYYLNADADEVRARVYIVCHGLRIPTLVVDTPFTSITDNFSSRPYPGR